MQKDVFVHECAKLSTSTVNYANMQQFSSLEFYGAHYLFSPFKRIFNAVPLLRKYQASFIITGK